MYNTTFHVKSRHYFYEECFFSSKTISRLNVVYYTYIPQNCFMFGCLDKYTNKRTKLCCYLSTSNHFIFPSSHGQCLVGAHIIYNHRIMETTIENDLRLCTILRNIDVRAGGGGAAATQTCWEIHFRIKIFQIASAPELTIALCSGYLRCL